MFFFINPKFEKKRRMCRELAFGPFEEPIFLAAVACLNSNSILIQRMNSEFEPTHVLFSQSNSQLLPSQPSCNNQSKKENARLN